MTSLTPYELVEKGRFKDAARAIEAIDRSTSLPVGLRVLRAKLEIHVGTLTKARESARELLDESLTNTEQSNCWEIIGRVDLSLGQLEDGLRAMNRAFSCACRGHDIQFEARLRANYVHALLHWVSAEAAAIEIPKLRQVTLHSGDIGTTIAVHVLVAEINARKGLTANASAHIDIARGLLRKFENIWLQGRLAIISLSAAVLRSDYSTALKFNEEALTCAHRSGSREILIPALANLAIIQLARTEFDAVRKTLKQLLAEMRKSGPSITEIGVRDIEMQLAIAEGDLDQATKSQRVIAELISALISQSEADDSYYELWHKLSRVRLLYSLGEVEAGLAVAIDAVPRIERLSDQTLLGRMRLLVAEGLGRVGRPVDAGAYLPEPLANEGSLELVAETCRVAGRLTAAENPEGAQNYFDRACRIFKEIGNLTAREEVERSARESLKRSADGQFLPPRAGGTLEKRAGNVGTEAARFSERIAALLQVGGHPKLLAQEALGLIADARATDVAAIVEIDPGGKGRIVATLPTHPSTFDFDDPALLRFRIGSLAGRDYELIARPPQTVSAFMSLSAIERLMHTAMTLVESRRAAREGTGLWPKETPEHQLGLICSSERMLDLIETIRRVATANVSVLLTGETGVGKELFARAVHQASARIDRVFLPFNCSTVPHDMFDSQLFGHKRGSFTGAIGDSAGVIRSAAGGTLFLDEIGEMAVETQPKLLRFLESGEILPLGETKPQLVDVRVVAATNANLDQLVADGRFREDLFYRLNVIRINIPPLRDRREEIPALVEHFLERFGRELQKPMLRIADETLEYLVLYRWPGNVRQLANEIRRLVAMAEPGSVIMPAHLADDIAASRRTVPANSPPRLFNEVVTRIDQPLSAAVEHIERAAIQRALSITDGRLDEAARMLGLSRKGLYLKRQRLGLG